MTVRAVYAAREEAQRRSFHPRLSASSLGDECERKLWYAFRWAHPPERHDGRLLRLFERGEVEEPRVFADLRSIGVDLVTHDDNGEQLRVTFANEHGSGRLDGLILSGLPEAPKARHVLEIKTHSAKSFASLTKKGVRDAKPEHYVQMQLYMSGLNVARALYWATNKDTDEIYTERVEYDGSTAITAIARAERIRDAHAPPPRLHDDPNAKMAFKCRSCPALGVCHQNRFAMRTCRSCIHATPTDNGGWRCELAGVALTQFEQENGCTAHRFLPGLVPGEQIDVEDAPTGPLISYAMHDGSTWIDGRPA